MIEKHDIHAISHITGGGFWENIPRVLPEGTKSSCRRQQLGMADAIFNWLQEKGNVDDITRCTAHFNCGVGLVVALPKEQAEAAVELLKAEGENAWVIGEIANAEAGEEQVEIK